MLYRLSLTALFLCCCSHSAPSHERIEEIARMLPEKPRGSGYTIVNRGAWAKLGSLPPGRNALRRAEGLLKAPIPKQPDELYLDFTKTGNRGRWQRVASQRRHALEHLLIAEAIENQRRFLPKLEAYIQAICAERTWVMPAHDRKLRNFKSQSVDIDLGSSNLGWWMASIDYVLGSKLQPATRRLLRERVDKFIIAPMHRIIAGKQRSWWSTTTNNWNAVCLAGVTGTALAIVESREERALFVAAAEELIKNFLKGFTPDGYCSEGVGYWNYGYGHFCALSELVYQATKHKVDLLAMPEAREPALFGARMQIINHVYPAFADCSVDSRPDSRIMRYVSRRLQLGLGEVDNYDPYETGGTVHGPLLSLFPDSASSMKAAETRLQLDPLRSWFGDAGVLICRPANLGSHLGVALKGGHNNEHHNHNDVGSYVVVVGKRTPIVDPGSEVYTARTFSGQRYTSNALNSYGHNVPRIAGTLQRTGKQARGILLERNFAPLRDEITFDLRSCYTVSSIKRLERRFIYDRSAKGSFTVQDTAAFSKPMVFESAILTFGDWKKVSDNRILVYEMDRAVEVEIATSGAFKIVPEEIKEDLVARRKLTRLGLRLEEPSRQASITLTYRETVSPLLPSAGELLGNGSFQHGGLLWKISDKGMSSIVREKIFDDASVLKIEDDSATSGSSMASGDIAVRPGQTYTLSGRMLLKSGGGLGIYLRYYDADGRDITPKDHRGYIDPILYITNAKATSRRKSILKLQQGKQERFGVSFQAPPNCTNVGLWLHSLNADRVTIYLDDLSIRQK